MAAAMTVDENTRSNLQYYSHWEDDDGLERTIESIWESNPEKEEYRKLLENNEYDEIQNKAYFNEL
jgi:hypothetical protein